MRKYISAAGPVGLLLIDLETEAGNTIVSTYGVDVSVDAHIDREARGSCCYFQARTHELG